MFTIVGKYTDAKVMIDGLEESCVAQINKFVNHPAFSNPVAIMPDAHFGRGSCIGFTMRMTDKLIPGVVGVDIGCGMRSFKIGKSLPMTLAELDHKIRQQVPFGQNIHENEPVHMKNEFPWHETNVLGEKFRMFYTVNYNVSMESVNYDMDWFMEKVKHIGGNLRWYINSIGSLGGGNHFVETGVDEQGEHWITIHSGSRHLGKKVCDFWQRRAEKVLRMDNMQKMRAEIDEVKRVYKGDKKVDAQKEIDAIKEKYGLSKYGIDINGLEWLEGNDATGYLLDMVFCQAYAAFNRLVMQRIIADILHVDPSDEIETVHNFVDFQDFIIRKGAIRSYEGERMLIPFNMRDGILVCEGKSNPEWNNSAPHGAGRVLGRNQAKKKLDLEKFKADMAGIYSTSVGQGTLDEAPDAYKDSKLIEEAIGPTATITNRIKPIHNMKDGMGFTDD